MTQRKPEGMSFETWVDHQIRTADERGAFADLPGAGKPLPKDDGPQDSYAWALAWARRQEPGAAFLPPSLALGRERDDLPDRLAALHREDRVRAAVREFNDRVAASWRTPLDGPPVVVRQHDEEALVAAWLASRPAPEPAAPPAAAPARRRRWRRSR
ncbi:DnaJ family domain-containing protein [Klenkia taihuensis]|uniref:DnaJ homologue subfamily C member 28 conserved domain-containing protein n=1 Tax=Klenkia taihuensis TaxID=1225127 RepID=A0A1I1GH74_9ACTN|nr:DUF1992 domain-containing protein [Klenkia taihuensis]GHE09754.1 DUF1992 domain-containing protein [Klenkia taihuensis]SFC10881.1 protein of unknown function [Klenkia taihuensis]